MSRLSNMFNSASGAAEASPVDFPAPAAFKVDDAKLESLLRSYCVDLTARIARDTAQSFYVTKGNKPALRAIERLGAQQTGPFITIFTGEAGVDTTYMLKVVAQNMAMDQTLKNARLLELDWFEVQRAQFAGQAMNNLLPLFLGLAERKGVFQGRKIILGIGDVDRYNSDAIKMSITSSPGTTKTFIENFYAQIFEGRLGIVMTATEQGASQLLGKDAGLSRRAEQIKVLPIERAAPLRLMQKITLKARKKDA